MISLQDKVAIVTGAGSGIGAGIAEKLCTYGARVAVVDIDEARAVAQTDILKKAGHAAQAFNADVCDESAVRDLVVAVADHWGSVDILVNNAGIIRDNFIENISEADWDAVLGVNLKGAFLCAKAVVPTMKSRGYGKIVNIISRSWLGNIGQSNYSASKGGLVSLTRTLALELAKNGINVNGVSPGLIDTPMTRSLPEKVREKLIRMQPTRQMGTVDDIAHAVCYLSSDVSRFVTGQILNVDGGKSVGLV